MGKQWKQWLTLFGGGLKITADGDCSHEIKRHLLLERKVMTDLDSILKSGDISLPTKIYLVQGYGFSSCLVLMWELGYKESWTPKNWCFWTVVLEKTLENPLGCKEIQPIHPKEISPGCSLQGLMLKLKLQYFGHLMRRTHWKRPWCWEKLRAVEEGDDREWNGWIPSPTEWTWVWINSGSWWWKGRPGVLQCMGLQKVGHDWGTELNWTELHIK